jgi:hypothetical protein
LCKISVSHNDADEDLSLCMILCLFVNRYPCFGEPVTSTFRVLVNLLDPEGGQQQLQKLGNYPLINMVPYPRRHEYFTDQLITVSSIPGRPSTMYRTSYEAVVKPKLHLFGTYKQF